MKTRSQTVPKPLNTVRLPPAASPGARSRARPRPRPRMKPKPGKKGALDDPRRPKKPATAFFYFMACLESMFFHKNLFSSQRSEKIPREDFRKTFQEENPSVKSMQDIGKAGGEKWNKMIFEEKVKYYDLATERRAEFEKAIAQYNKKKENGELSEESDDDL